MAPAAERVEDPRLVLVHGEHHHRHGRPALADQPHRFVYRREGNWYLVGTSTGGRAWLHPSSTGRFFPLDELVVNRLNWLTEAWDTHLRDTPDLRAPAKEAPVPRTGGQEVPANVLESRTAGGTLWFRVEVQRDSPCETGGTPPVIATGWIPAWGRDGKPTVWFYSRGC